MYRSICWYLHIVPVLHRPDLIDIGVNTIPYAKGTIEFDQFLVVGVHMAIYVSI